MKCSHFIQIWAIFREMNYGVILALPDFNFCSWYIDTLFWPSFCMFVLVCVGNACGVWHVARSSWHQVPSSVILHDVFSYRILLNLASWLSRLSSQQDPRILLSPSLGTEIRGEPPHWLFPNSGSCAYTANTSYPCATFSPWSSVFMYRMCSVIFQVSSRQWRLSNSSLSLKDTQLTLCGISLSHYQETASSLQSSWIR